MGNCCGESEDPHTNVNIKDKKQNKPGQTGEAYYGGAV